MSRATTTGASGGEKRSRQGGAGLLSPQTPLPQSCDMSVVRRRLTISDCAASSRIASPATAPIDMVPRSGASRASSASATGANSVRSRLGASSAARQGRSSGQQGSAGECGDMGQQRQAQHLASSPRTGKQSTAQRATPEMQLGAPAAVSTPATGSRGRGGQGAAQGWAVGCAHQQSGCPDVGRWRR